MVDYLSSIYSWCPAHSGDKPWYLHDISYAFKADGGWAYNAFCEYSCDCPAGYTFQSGNSTGSCVKYQAVITINSPKPQVCAGNPIDIATGAKIQREDDIVAKGDGQVSFSRYYRTFGSTRDGMWFSTYSKYIGGINLAVPEKLKEISLPYASKEDACVLGVSSLKSKLPTNWADAAAVFSNDICNVYHNGKAALVVPIVTTNAEEKSIDASHVSLQREDGSILNYEGHLATWFPVDGDTGKLEQISTVYDYVTVSWRYTTMSGDIEEYSDKGKLLSITNSNGMKQTLTYDPVSGLLMQVQDSTGRKLLFTYTNGKITSVTTSDNKTTTYAYNANGLVSDVKRPSNAHRTYQYEDSRFPTFLTGITDERGVRYVTWSYDGQGRAISSEHAGGAEKTLLSFNADGSTTVTNELNKQTIYRFDDIFGAPRVSSVEGQPTANCIGANQTYTYSTQGWIESKTDWNGNKTTYTYNMRGQEVSRTEAAGTVSARTITTTRDLTLNRITKITEPETETTFNYDANGLLLTKSVHSLISQ